MLDVLSALVRTVLTFGVIALVIGGIAVMFIVVFTLANGFDRRIGQ